MNVARPLFAVSLLVILFTPGLHAQNRLQSLSTDFEARDRLQRAEAEAVATRLGLPIRALRPDGSLIELKRLRDGKPIYFTTDNANAAKTISTDKVYPGGIAGLNLAGSGVTLYEWDAGGVRGTHQEFGGRVLSSQGTLHFHSTHVAGTMIAAGISPAAKGMAYDASLSAWDWTSDISEMSAAAAAGMRVSNHSYGLITGWYFGYINASRWTWFGDPSVSQAEDYAFGFYDQEAQDWDAVANAAPYYLIVKSAGNDRNEGPSGSVLHDVFIGGSWVTSTTIRNKDGNGGYDCLSASSVAKNPLVVAAVNDLPGGYSTAAGVVMSSFSSWGPADDGRIKPDISANGVGLTSTLETSDVAYGSLSGTSMATPSVSGSIGLLLQHQQNLHGNDSILATTMKAIILHTADEAGPDPGPDYMFGWGLMNTRKAADLMTLDTTDGPESHIREYAISTGDTVEVHLASTGAGPLRATLCWNDIPGSVAPASIDPTDPNLLNDLDLRIIRNSDGAVFYPWKCDPSVPSAAATRSGDNDRDNVEQVQIDSPGHDYYTVRITHKNIIFSAPTHASLVISGNTYGPAIAAATDTASYTKLPGDTFTDSIRIYNRGDQELITTITKDPGSFWLSLTEDSVNVPPLDSTMVHFSVNGALWSRWTDYTATLTFGTNDVYQPEMEFTVTVSVLGPTFIATPGSLVIDLDSAEVGTDSLKIRNAGVIPLNVVVTDSAGPLPSWITAEPDTFTVPPGDSVAVVLTTNALNETPGDYTTTLKFVHDDSSQPPGLIPVFLNVGARRLFPLGVVARWNIVSLPVEPVNGAKIDLFPDATTAASGFNGAYYQADTLITGPGYWVKFPAGGSYIVDGYSYDLDTIPLFEGWNLVGSLFESVAASSVVTDPPGIIASGFYGYEGGYALAESILPGRGYWVLSDADGSMFLSSAPGASPKAAAKFDPAEYNALTLAGSTGGSATLYFSSAGTAPAMRSHSALPPKPPAGAFDARFSDDAFFASFGAGAGEESRTINVAGTGGELRLSARLKKDAAREYFVADASGTLHPLRDGATLRLRVEAGGETSLRLVSGAGSLPTEFALAQNYPNPFNPATTVSFSLPADENVTIRLYNILGTEVATIASRRFAAGTHEVSFNAGNLASGVYVYTMQAGPFSASRKMVLMR